MKVTKIENQQRTPKGPTFTRVTVEVCRPHDGYNELTEEAKAKLIDAVNGALQAVPAEHRTLD